MSRLGARGTRGPARAIGLLLVGLAALPPSAAVPYDPDFRWRTIQTPHFDVTFHQGEEALAQRVAAAFEKAHARLVPILGYAPPVRTQVVLSDDSDEANGSATPLPRDIIRLYAVPPDSASVLQDSHDWVTQLVDHEYTHILHLDQVSGFPAAVNSVMGKIWVPNGFLPGWITEGIAVEYEAEDDVTGRNHSSLFDMYARAMVVEPPGLPSLAVVTNQPLEWPQGNTAYLLGGRFVAWVLANHGAAALRGFMADQGRQVWPWAPSWAAEPWFGADLPALWEAYRAELQGRYEAELAAIRSRPVTRPRRLTHRGGNISRPRWTPDGQALVYLDHGPNEQAGLRRVSADGRELGLALPVKVDGPFALRSAREAVVSEGQVWHEFRLYDDLYLADLERGTARRLTDGERGTDPALTPDGSAVVYVARIGGGELELRRRRLPDGPPERLLHLEGAQLYDPAVSPDGRRIALSIQAGGRRDLYLLEDGWLTRLTDDHAIDLEPTWTPDGRWLLFASDRGGVFNVHAWSVETGDFRQVTNLETGALDPAVSPDGRTIAFSGYDRFGHDVVTIPFDPSTWLEEVVGSTTTRGDTALVGPPAGEVDVAPLAPPAGEPMAPHPYVPWTALPTFWLPMLASDSVTGTTLGVFSTGADVVGLHTWQLQGSWNVDHATFGYAASYVGGWSWPSLDLLSERVLEPAPGAPARFTTAWTPLAAGATFTFQTVYTSLQLRLGWSATRWDTLGPAVPTSGVSPSHLFEDGLLSEVGLGAAYSSAQSYTWSISPEEGRTISLRLRLAAPETGSDYDLWRARASWIEYLRVPGTRHVVLAARLSGALGHGSLGGYPPFSLGGVSSADPIGLFLLQTFSPADQLRGYPAGALAGHGTVLGNLELRLPISWPEWGRSTWPLFLRRLDAALFVDAGQAFVQGTERGDRGPDFHWDQLRVGAGAELRLELVVAYWLVTDLRLGLARGLGLPLAGVPPQQDPLAEWQWYVTLGPSY